MQFAAQEIATDAADANALQEVVIPTGLTISGDFAWLIHSFEFELAEFFGVVVADARVRLGLSVQQGLAAMPEIVDAGCIHQFDTNIIRDGVGPEFMVNPFEKVWLPPVIIAAPRISLYLEVIPDAAEWRALTSRMRLGYTTIPIDTKAYYELLQTWEAL